MAWEYYDFIGVPRTATTDEVKRACFRKRKELTIAGDQKGLEFLNQVQSVLLDKDARAEYDALQEYGAEIDTLMAEAHTAMSEERWTDAVAALKLVLALIPGQPTVMNELGLCYVYSGRYPEAIDVYRKLVTSKPEVALYHSNYGHVLFLFARITPANPSSVTCKYCGTPLAIATRSGVVSIKCSQCEESTLVNLSGDKQQLLEDSRSELSQAINLEPHNPSNYTLMAQTFEHVGEYDTALQWVEKSLNADGRVDVADTERLLYAARLHAVAGRLDKVLETARRLQSLPVEDRFGYHQYVGYSFAELARETLCIYCYDVADVFAEASQLFLPNDERISVLRDVTRLLVRASREKVRCADDPLVAPPVRFLAHAVMLRVANPDTIDHETMLGRFYALAKSYSVEVLISSINRLRTGYPNLYACDGQLFDDVLEMLTRARTGSQGTSPSADDCCGSCCAMPVALVLILVLLAVAARLMETFGIFLGKLW